MNETTDVKLVAKKPRQVPIGFCLPDKPVTTSQIQLAKDPVNEASTS